MRHLTNILLLAPCFGMAPATFAQTGEHFSTYGSRYIEAQMTTTVTGDPFFAFSDSIGERIAHFGGPLRSVRFTTIDVYSTEDVPSMITVYDGDVYGPIVTTVPIMVPGLNKVFPPGELMDLTREEVQDKAFEYMWNATIELSYSFEALMTEYMLDLMLEPGDYTFIISTDPTHLHEYSDGLTHAPQLACVTNYTTIDPYQEGYALIGGCIGQGGDSLREVIVPHFSNFGEWMTIDMAFEYTVSELSTQVEEMDTSAVPIRYLYEEFIFDQPGQAVVYDVAGKRIAEGSNSQPISTTGWTSGAYTVDLSTTQQRYTKKFWVN